MSIFRNKLFLAVILGHFAIDIFNSMGPVVVAFLSTSMLLTTAQIGLAISLYQLCTAITQPFFGWWADRFGSRWLGPSSVAWTIGFISLAIWLAQTTQNFMLFVFVFSLAGFGSAAFHPLGTMHAATASERAATSTSVFFLFGQTGLALGPVLAGILLTVVGPPGIYGLAALSLPLLIFMAGVMARQPHPPLPATIKPEPESLPHPEPKPAPKRVATGLALWGAVALLATLMGLRSWALLGTVSFLPKMFQDMGWTPAAYGAITGTYWMASAIMGVVAGAWADRWGRRQVVFVTMLLGSLPLYFLPITDSWLAFPLAISVGGLMGASHSILVVIAQDLMPQAKALVSGLTLGYLFGIGALATWVIGTLAEGWGLAFVIQLGTILGIISACLAWLLPSTSQTPHPPLQVKQAPAQ